MKTETVKTFLVQGIEHAWIPGYEKRYSATRCGKVYSWVSKKGFREIGSYSKQHLCSYVRLTKEGGAGGMWRARAVLSAWTGISSQSPLYALRIDGDPLNDRLENLKWGTQKESLRNASMKGKCSKQKLNFTEYREILDLYHAKIYTQQELAEIYEVSQPAISYIVRKNAKKPSYYRE